MAKSNDVEINLTAKTEDAARAINNFSGTFKRSFTEINAALQLAKAGFALVQGAISSVSSVVSEAIKLAQEQERVERRISAALKARGDATGEAFKDLQEFNNALQQRLGYGDEELLQMQGTLLAMGVHKSELKAATEAAIGFADAQGVKTKTAIKIVGQALTGNVSVLKGYGIEVKNVADAQGRFNDMFTMANAQAGTTATNIKILKANYGDLFEALGDLLIKGNEFQPVWDALNDAILAVKDQLADPAFRDLVSKTMVELAQILTSTAKAVVVLANSFGVLSDQVSDGLIEKLGAVQEKLAEMRWADPAGPMFGPEPPPSNALAQGKLGASVVPKPRKEETFDLSKIGGDQTDELDVWNEAENERARKKKLEEGYKEAMAMRKAFEREFAASERAFLREQHNEAIVAQIEAYENAMSMMSGVTASAFSTMIQGIASGSMSVGRAMARFVGTIITQIGTMLIQIGIAGQAMSALSFIFPAAIGGFAAGLIAVTAGAAMVALGTAISGAAAPSRSTSLPTATKSTSSSSMASRPEVMSPVGVASANASPINVTVNFNGVVTNPRRTAREIQGILATAV